MKRFSSKNGEEMESIFIAYSILDLDFFLNELEPDF